MTDIYDDPDINTGEDDFPDSVTLDRVGDGVRGRVLLIEKAGSKYGPALKYTVYGVPRGPSNHTKSEGQTTMLARPKNLRAQMIEKRPRIGDTIDVELIELRNTAQGTAKLFDVEVTQGDASQLGPVARQQPQAVHPSVPDPGRPSAPVVADDEGEDIFDK